jgi:hypothetical protein
MNAPATPSLETLAGLYRAAFEQQQASDTAMARVLESVIRHGYTEEQVAQAAGLRIEPRIRKSA